MKYYDTIIIGSGASGTMCALNIKNKKVAMMELVSKPFKKILVTGNGRCNITNNKINEHSYNIKQDNKISLHCLVISY